MKSKLCFIALIIFLLSFNLSAQTNSVSEDDQWPSFRGNNANGVSKSSLTPASWNVDSGKNIKWKTDIPGLAHSCPIIWNDLVFVTTAVSGKKDPEMKVGLYGSGTSVDDNTIHEWKLYCLNKNSGKILWEKTSYKGIPEVKRHPKSTQANSTPVTNGKYVVAFFGSEGIYCYDMEGNIIWKKDFGVLDSGAFDHPEAQWGFASSPIIHKNVVIVQCDVQKNSFLASFDIKTGKQIWRIPRNEQPTWGTPAIYSKNNSTHIIVNGYKHIGAYDFETGREIWKMKGGGDVPVPTPVIAHDLIYINSAHGKMSPIYAIRPTATGDITLKGKELSNDNIVWSIRRGGAYMQTALIYENYLYNLRGNGSLTCFNAKTGEQIYRERLGKSGTSFSASGVASKGKLYFSSEQGTIFVVKPGADFEILAENSMNDICMATPAISDDTLFFRTHHYLIAVSEK